MGDNSLAYFARDISFRTSLLSLTFGILTRNQAFYFTMSSTATQRTLLLALSGVSLAALFIWYLRSKKGRATRRDLSVEDLKQSAKTENVDSITVRRSKPCEQASNHIHRIKHSSVNSEPSQKCGVVSETPNIGVTLKMTTALESEPASKIDPSSASLISGTVNGVEEGCVIALKKTSNEEELKQTEADSSVSNGVQEEEQVCKKAVDLELVLDVSHQTEPEAFSWSDEMERSYVESCRKEEEEQRQQDVNAVNGGSGDYATSDSPGLASQNSEVSSQDSGRATGGLASSLSPMDEAGDVLPMYEFEIPNTLVGLVIGIKGKTIKELSSRTDVRMLIRAHHTPEKVDTHQICQVRGKREQINRCLQMLRRRFPPARFPELNLQPVLPPPIANNLFDALASQPSWLTLPDAIPCEVVCSSVIDPGHFFLQQPTHPSFSSLSHLDMYMIRLYSQGSDIPDLPKPCQTGLLCAAPVLGAWFRAVTVSYYPENDEVMLRFVDYGGYTRLPRSDLRQIRTDLMSLPFQAIECYLAHVQPIDGTWQWGEAAFAHFQKLCMGKVINATVVGFNVHDKVPMVELTVLDEENKPIRVDKDLMDAGFAKASDPSKLQKVTSTKGRLLSSNPTPMVAAV
ncbi:A-kinase anchor protein 1 mitochondrial [Trichostrongylus colubriformis]|uniref:A-kinase anchor protein 1 mitochondrial n=1 Tax=Trichostrongylus colubriformis TaxID=6319 RepID=A0AAN8F899_TRICO